MAAAKKHFVTLGGRDIELRYTRSERKEIEARFNTDMRTFLYEHCFPMKDGKLIPGGRLECQEALIWYGVRHSGPKMTEERVSELLADLTDKGGSIYGPITTAIVAVLASGVLGWTPPQSAEEDEPGKDEEPSPAA